MVYSPTAVTDLVRFSSNFVFSGVIDGLRKRVSGAIKRGIFVTTGAVSS